MFGSFEITSIRLYTPLRNPLRGLHGVYNLIEVISNEPNKNCDQSLNISKAICHALLELIDMSRGCLFYCLICHEVVRFIDVGGIVDNRFLNTIMKHHMLGEGQLLLHIMNGQYQHCFRGKYTQKVKT